MERRGKRGECSKALTFPRTFITLHTLKVLPFLYFHQDKIFINLHGSKLLQYHFFFSKLGSECSWSSTRDKRKLNGTD